MSLPPRVLQAAAVSTLLVALFVTFSVILSRPKGSGQSLGGIPVSNEEGLKQVIAPFNATTCSELLCSSHGSCLYNQDLDEENRTYTCNCSRWYYGPTCNMSCPLLCSGRGDCTSTAGGVKESHYFSPTQDLALLANVSKDTVVVQVEVGAASSGPIAPHSRTVSAIMDAICTCDVGFYGPSCESECSQECHNGGYCASNGECLCMPSFSGPTCDLFCPNCTYGECTVDPFALNSPPVCQCFDGYYGPNCDNSYYPCVNKDIISLPNVTATGNDTLVIISTALHEECGPVSRRWYIVDAGAGHLAVTDFQSSSPGLSLNIIAPHVSNKDSHVLDTYYVWDKFYMASSSYFQLFVDVLWPNNISFNITIQRFPCGLGCSSCDDEQICQCGNVSSQECYCVTSDGNNLCNATESDTVSETQAPTPSPPNNTYLVSWAPILPQANSLPLLFHEEVSTEEINSNYTAVIFFGVLLGLYFLILIAVYRCLPRYHGMESKQHASNRPKSSQEHQEADRPLALEVLPAQARVDGEGVEDDTTSTDKIQLQSAVVNQESHFWTKYWEELVNTHPLLSVIRGETLAHKSKVDYVAHARVTALICDVCLALTLSAVWYGSRKDLAEYISSSVVVALILQPVSSMTRFLFQIPNNLHPRHKAIIKALANLVSIVAVAWCSYVCILVSLSFGSRRTRNWILSFLLSLLLDLTVFHAGTVFVIVWGSQIAAQPRLWNCLKRAVACRCCSSASRKQSEGNVAIELPATSSRRPT